MSRKKVEGVCSICGAEGKLTFEHVPPKAAFNSSRVIFADWERALNAGPDGELKGRVQQGGAGYYSICERCNNNTGGWYGSAFVSFSYQGMEKLYLSGEAPVLYYPFYIFPLRVIKQIVSMFFSINSSMGKHSDYLSRFILNKEMKYLPDGLRIYLYYKSKGRLRYAGFSGVHNIASGRTKLISELAFPPFGYVFSFSGDKPDPRLIDITHFASYDYDNWRDIELRLPALETHLAFPGDYRTIDQIHKDIASNELARQTKVLS